MYRTTRLKITDINPHLKCVLCGGYFVDATTIIECLHSFCRTCILRYLESSKFCPICDVMIHKTRPVTNIRADKTLQNLVYKLVPGLYNNEMKRRREYYGSHPPDEKKLRLSPEALGFECKGRVIYTEDEPISVSLELSTSGMDRTPTSETSETSSKADVRYLQCPSAVTVALIKKFVRLKYDLSPVYKIDIFHSDEALKDDLTLMDIAYIYTWRRRGPLKLFYSVYENGVKRVRLQCTEKELTDGTKPVPLNKEPGAKVVVSEAETKLDKKEAEKGSQERNVTNIGANVPVSETEKGQKSQKQPKDNILNGCEKVNNSASKPLEMCRTVDNVNKAKPSEPSKNNMDIAESTSVKQEVTEAKGSVVKGKDCNDLQSSTPVLKTGKEQTSQTNSKINNRSNGSTTEDKSESIKNSSPLPCPKVNSSNKTNGGCMNGSNEKSTVVQNGISHKSDKVSYKDKAVNGLELNKPAAPVKDKTLTKGSSTNRKIKQPKRSLDDTVAKCKARELALQANGNQQRISNGGAG